MNVSLEIPDAVWWKLTERSQRAGLDVPDLIVRGIVTELHRPVELSEKERSRARRRAVVALVEEGLPDALIAERTGELVAFVRSARRAAGYKPNRQHRSETEGKAA